MGIRRALIGLAGASALLVAAPGIASADVTMTSSPPATVSWTLSPTGSNTISGGSLTVQATQAYQVTVVADQTRLTEWVTAGSAYAANPRTIGAALNVLTSLQSGLGVPVAAVIAGTSPSLIATGTGTVLTPANDTFAISLSQSTAITDSALPAGRTYHLVLTYTASATL